MPLVLLSSRLMPGFASPGMEFLLPAGVTVTMYSVELRIYQPWPPSLSTPLRGSSTERTPWQSFQEIKCLCHSEWSL